MLLDTIEILDYAYDELPVYVTGKCAWLNCEANIILRTAEDLAMQITS